MRAAAPHSKGRGSARMARVALAALAGLLAAALLAGPAASEVRRIEEVGVVPLRGAASRGAARDAAKQSGLRAAVERVAREFLMERPDGEGDVDLRKVLGDRMVPYTTRFRVVEDQGERPAQGQRSRTEYVVVVEVFVDADRVRQRLVDAGVLEQDPVAGRRTHVELELRGIQDYAAVTAVRELLTERLGAEEAVPVLFEQDLAVLDVHLSGRTRDAAALADALASRSRRGLSFRSLEADASRAVVAVTWRPPVSAEGD